MPSNSRKLEVRVTSEARDFDRGMQKASRSAQSFSQQMDQANRGGVQKFNSGMDIASQRLRNFVGIAGAALASGALIGWASDLRDSANALGESVNAIKVVFGDAADTVLQFGQNAATSVGLAQSEFNKLVTPIGSLLQNFGFSAQEAADGAIELTQRAADMASVFNVDVSEALEAIQAALRGESDPIEKFGGSISAARVEALLLNDGLVASKSAITDADKVMGRYKLILEDTARVQGDFANTAEQNANKTRTFQARLEDLRAKVGQSIIPLFDQLVDTGDDLLPVLEDFGTNVLPVVVDALGDFIAGVAAIAEGLGALPGPIKVVTVGLLGLSAAAKTLYANPVIAGLALVAAGIAYVGDKAREEKGQVDDLRVAIEKLRDTGQDADLTSTIRQDIEDFILSSEKWRDELKNVGLTIDDLTGFALNQPEAVQRVTDAIDGYAQRLADINQIDPNLVFFEQRLHEIQRRYVETADAVDEQRRAEFELNKASTRSATHRHANLVDQKGLRDALRHGTLEMYHQSKAAKEEAERLRGLHGAVGDLAIAYQQDLSKAVSDYLTIFDEAEKVKPEEVASPKKLLSNAEERLSRIQTFLSGLERLREEGLTNLVLEFQTKGVSGQSVAELQGLIRDIDKGGETAFTLDKTIGAGKDQIDELTTELAAKLARDKQPVLDEAQRLGVDIGKAIGDGLESIGLQLRIRVAAQSSAASTGRIGNAFAGRTRPVLRASGGPANPNETYIVGDGGRAEVLEMGSSRGMIHPSIQSYLSQMLRQGPISGAGSGIQFSQHNTFYGVKDAKDAAYRARRELSRELRNFQAGQNRRI